MKPKLLNLLLVFASLLGYLKWGHDKKMFLFEIEKDLFVKLFSNPLGVLHPLTILPVLGQILLLYTLFQKYASKRHSYVGIFCICILYLFILFVGIVSAETKIITSTIPFLLLSVLVILYQKKTKQ